MDSSVDWTAITGIVVSGVVGPSVALVFSAVHQRAVARRDTWERDRLAGRALLDEAVRSGHEAVGYASTLPSLFMTEGSKLGTDEGGGAFEIAKLRATGQEADVIYARVAVFFGPDSDIAASFKRTVDGVESVLTAARRVHGFGAASTRDTQKALDAGLKQAQEGERELLAVAHAFGGARRASPRSWRRWRPRTAQPRRQT